MKKIICSFLILLFAAPFVFSASKEIDMISLFPDSSIVYPRNADFENIIDISADSELVEFKNQLAREFDIAWCDDNFDTESRKALAKSTSPILSDLLPCTEVLFSRPVLLSGGEKSFRIKELKEGKVYSVILQKGKIISLTKI